MSQPARSLVSVAIPLYRSAQFVENIAGNIDRLTYAPLEILLSDRHGEDDALDQLARRYAGDPRVRVLRSRDRADWATHYNELMAAATGDYFLWMPHDDVYEAGHVEALARTLDERPEAVLAFGFTTFEDAGLAVPMQPFVPPPILPGEPWAVRVALRLFVFWQLFFVVRGLFRRRLARDRHLVLPRTRGTVFADVYWAFSMILAGPIVHVPDAKCRKRYQAVSASSVWQFGLRQAIEECRVTSGLLWQSRHPRHQVVLGIGVMVYLTVVRLCWRTARPLIGWPGRRGPAAGRSVVLRPLAWGLGLSNSLAQDGNRIET